MLGLPPVYEEGDDPARGGNRKPPCQQHSVRTPSTPELYLSQVDTVALCVFYDSFQVRPFGGPCNQPRCSKLVDAETPRPDGLWLIWIRSNDFEVNPLAQTNQRIASASARVLTSRDRLDPEKSFDSLNSSRKIRCGINQVIDPGQ